MKTMFYMEKKVDDLPGLYEKLRSSEFAVLNVAADGHGTYVYLEDHEEKDPASLVEGWMNHASKKDASVPEKPVSSIKKFFRKIF